MDQSLLRFFGSPDHARSYETYGLANQLLTYRFFVENIDPTLHDSDLVRGRESVGMKDSSRERRPSMSIHPDALAANVSSTIGLSNDRRQTLVSLIIGLVNARTVNLSHLAGTFCGPAKLASNYRRLQRFFQYVRLDGDWLAKTLVALLRLAPPYRLCLDRTNWKVGRKDVNMLVLCIVTRHVRIPALWEILDHGGGSSMAQRKALLVRFMALLGKRSIKLLLADKEFIGNQ